jgi:toxin FitB
VRYLLDTNVISELVARQPNPRVVQWIDQLDPDNVYLSVITIGELRKGIEKLPDSKRRHVLRDWLYDDLLTRFSGNILVLDTPAMLAWGELTGRLEREKHTLPAIDSLIAALALHNNCTLVTRNVRDFEATGIVLLNPWD